MKWLKKWAYLIVFAGVGFAYLTCVDAWQVYAKPLSQINKWIAERNAENVADDRENTTESSGDVASGSGDRTEEGTDQGSVGGSQADEAGSMASGNEDRPAEGTSQGSTGELVGGNGDLLAEGTSQGGEGDVASGNGDRSEEGATQGDAGEMSEGITQGTVDEVADDATELNGDESIVEDALIGAIEPVYMTVEDDYFSDAVFIGDSRTVGMYEYGDLEEIATFYASTGLSVYDIFKEEFVKLPNRKKKASVLEALEESSFAKVYLMLGINEMGTGTAETFAAKYAEVLARIRELQPDAIIYIQGIMKVSAKRSAQGDYIHNEGITARNEAIAQLADNEKVFYLDVNPLICDESGGMVAEYTTDGVHLKAKYIGIWKQFLKEHAISQME